ncbi:MAG TPA: cytochrome c oxidase subunit II [Woeseiaceae bacterium]|nr:cytochrome c oxidase subunit II [Woeseiaceae bacterium]
MTRRLLLGLALLIAAGSASADWAINMPQGVSEMSLQTYRLHMQVFWWCVAIGIVVFAVMIYTMVKHRRSRGHQAAQFHHNTKLEVVWTAIPVLILLIMAVPAAETLVELEYNQNPDLTVVVTGYQWRWHYDYPDHDISFFSSLDARSNQARRKRSGIDPYQVENYLLEVDNPLVVPRGAKVRVLITSKDVIHAWWVPALAIKKDAIPGFMNAVWFRAEESGTYRGQCAELCGMDHAYMPVVVEVVEPEAFAAWVEAQRGGEAAQAASDQAAAATRIAARHDIAGD